MTEFSILSLKKRSDAINRYDGKDADFDKINDGMEIQEGLHDTQNKPLHRLGPSTPGSAKVTRNGVEFDFDNSIIDLRVRKGGKSGGKYTMPTPKKMKLSVNMGGNHDQSGFRIDSNLSPHKHTLNDSKIQKIGHLNFSKITKKRKVTL